MGHLINETNFQNKRYDYDAILLRYGEVGLKSQRKRPYFEKLYVNAIKEALKRNNVDFDYLENAGGRFILSTKNVDDALNILKEVPGIQSISPAKTILFNNKSELLKNSFFQSKDLIEKKIFRVTVRRTGKHEFTSMNFAKELGELLHPFSKGVSLKNPEINIQIEIRNNKAYLFTKSIKCLDGMPSSSSGKAICLFSGGIDSPVAAFQMLKRGVALDYLYIDLSGKLVSMKNIVALYNHLTSKFSFNYKPKFYLINGQKIIEEITKNVPSSFRQLALKIVFYKLAEFFVIKKNYSSFVTGESIAQKSSQTLSSLSFINSQINSLVIRPLISMDKLEISSIAEKIGTFGASQFVKEFCDLSEGKAVTASPLMKDLKQIPSFDTLIENLFNSSKCFKSIIDDSVFKEENVKINGGVISIDVRLPSKSNFDILDTDKKIAYSNLLFSLDELDSSKKYLFVCEYGVQSKSLVYACEQRNILAFAMSKQEFKFWKNK